MTSANPDLTLPGNVKMPQVGLGTMRLKEGEHADYIEHALDAGYRLLDTAYIYRNQKLIGEVLKKRIDSGRMKREDVFVTTKLAGIFMHSDEAVRRCMDMCLADLQLDYVDLFLMHAPCGFQYINDDELFPMDGNGKPKHFNNDIVATWKTMETLVDLGLTRTIGVSNFNVSQLKRILEIARIPVSNLQVEGHVYLQQRELREFCQSHGISVTLYGNLGGIYATTPGLPVLLEDPVVAEIAAANNISKGQVLLTFLIAEGFAIIPKSAKKSRLEENLKAASVSLSEADMNKLRTLDAGVRYYSMKSIFEGHPERPF